MCIPVHHLGKAIVASIVLGGLGVGAYIAPWDYWLGIEEEEDAAVFNTSHYINGVNTAFEKADAIELFAGSFLRHLCISFT